MIRQRPDIQSDCENLFKGGSKLCDEETIAQHQFKEGDQIYSINRIKGGISFNFNSLDKKKIKVFKPSAKKYRLVCKGLNLEAICKNKDCIAFGKKVWIQRGFGTFQLSKQIFHCYCPLCKEKTQDATNIGYCLTHIKFEGKKRGNQEYIQWEETVVKNGLTTFKDRDTETREWNYMEITTTRL